MMGEPSVGSLLVRLVPVSRQAGRLMPSCKASQHPPRHEPAVLVPAAHISMALSLPASQSSSSSSSRCRFDVGLFPDDRCGVAISSFSGDHPTCTKFKAPIFRPPHSASFSIGMHAPSLWLVLAVGKPPSASSVRLQGVEPIRANGAPLSRSVLATPSTQLSRRVAFLDWFGTSFTDSFLLGSLGCRHRGQMAVFGSHTSASNARYATHPRNVMRI